MTYLIQQLDKAHGFRFRDWHYDKEARMTTALTLTSEQLQQEDKRIVALRPDFAQAPNTVRWATLLLAEAHGLDPLSSEIIPLQVAGQWQPYITLEGARGNADRRGLDYQRVLSPLSDKWAEEFFGLTAEETRQMMRLDAQDMVWICAIYVNGKPHPFVHLGVVGPTFPYKGKTAQWRMAAIRAERPALLAACHLPYRAGLDAVSLDVGNGETEAPVEGEVTFLADLSVYDEFLARVCEEIPYFSHPVHVVNTLAKLELEYSVEEEAALFDALNEHANMRANEKAAENGNGQAPLFNPEDEEIPWE